MPTAEREKTQELPDTLFKQHDALERLEYAEMLKTLIDHSEDYRRENDSKSYVIAVDSPWGTGKSFFFDMFHNLLLGRKCEEDAVSEDAPYAVIRYNAWKNDFWDNAFEPFMLEMTRSGIFKRMFTEEKLTYWAEKVTKCAADVVWGYTTQKVREVLGDDAVQSIKDRLGEKGIGIAPELQVIQEQQLELKNTLGDFLCEVEPEKTMVVIIDELDRCRPTFAIQTMEIAKHFLDIPGVVYIFALDVEQLSHSVRTVYGQGMDAPGYICRFFDYISKMPRADLRTLAQWWLHHGHENTQGMMAPGRGDAMPGEMSEYFVKLAGVYGLSTRDLDTVIQNYRLMFDMLLWKYRDDAAHHWYAFLLVLKYKRPEVYVRLFENGRRVDAIREISEVGTLYDGGVAAVDLLSIDGGTKIKEIEFRVYSWDGKKRSSGGKGFLVRHAELSYGAEEDIGSAAIKAVPRPSSPISESLQLKNGIESLNCILFAPDFADWERMKELTLVEFFQRRMEIFSVWNGQEKTAAEASR